MQFSGRGIQYLKLFQKIRQVNLFLTGKKELAAIFKIRDVPFRPKTTVLFQLQSENVFPIIDGWLNCTG